MTKCVYRNCTEEGTIPLRGSGRLVCEKHKRAAKMLGIYVILTIVILAFIGIVAVIWLTHS